MSLKDWLVKKLSGDDSARLELSAEEEYLSDLNLKEVLDAHMSWRQKLVNKLDGSSDKSYDIANVAQDNLCVLGKWIYGPGQSQYANLPEFEVLRKVHSEFHICAGEVLIQHENNDLQQANHILNGKFRNASNHLQLNLVRLFTAVNA